MANGGRRLERASAGVVTVLCLLAATGPPSAGTPSTAGAPVPSTEFVPNGGRATTGRPRRPRADTRLDEFLERPSERATGPQTALVGPLGAETRPGPEPALVGP